MIENARIHKKSRHFSGGCRIELQNKAQFYQSVRVLS